MPYSMRTVEHITKELKQAKKQAQVWAVRVGELEVERERTMKRMIEEVV